MLALTLGGIAGAVLGPRSTFVVGGVLTTLAAVLLLPAVRHARPGPAE